MLKLAWRGAILVLILAIWGSIGQAAPYAALVMDARDGTVLHARNADTRLHPASLTKMMTLYLVFDAIEHGRLSLDQKVTISRYAASRPPSKLGLKRGQKIELRYLVRASAVKSANDAAAAMAEAVAGSEAAFARKMTATAKAMGMTRTTFKNASGLTQAGHLSTARDMAVLGRRLFYDFPQYYNLFSRRSTSAKVKTVYNTNRRLLAAYPGADGIKTGYTNAAGFNLVSSARRGQKRVIVAMFGGKSSQRRNRQVAELMDLGLSRMPARKAVVKPRALGLPQAPTTVMASASAVRPLKASQRPQLRATSVAAPAPTEPPAEQVAEQVDVAAIAAAVSRALTDGPAERIEMPVTAAAASPADAAVVGALRIQTSRRPVPRPAGVKEIRTASAAPAAAEAAQPARARRAGGSYVVQIGGIHNRSDAERLLLRTALQEMEALEGSRRELQPTAQPGWYRARFVGLSAEAAEAACARLAARQTPCQVSASGG